MSRNTLNFALPESMRAYVDARVASGHYGNTSEYLRELIRKDQAVREQRSVSFEKICLSYKERNLRGT